MIKGKTHLTRGKIFLLIKEKKRKIEPDTIVGWDCFFLTIWSPFHFTGINRVYSNIKQRLLFRCMMMIHMN